MLVKRKLGIFHIELLTLKMSRKVMQQLQNFSLLFFFLRERMGGGEGVGMSVTTKMRDRLVTIFSTSLTEDMNFPLYVERKRNIKFIVCLYRDFSIKSIQYFCFVFFLHFFYSFDKRMTIKLFEPKTTIWVSCSSKRESGRELKIFWIQKIQFFVLFSQENTTKAFHGIWESSSEREDWIE